MFTPTTRVPSLLLISMLLLLCEGESTFGQQSAATRRTVANSHQWEAVKYPMITTSDFGLLGFHVGREKENGLRFGITLFGTNLPKAGEFTAHLHRKSGNRVEPFGGQSTDFGVISTGLGSQRSALHLFPWGSNIFEEGWIECRLGTQAYWLELPYGFTRDPAEALGPATANAVEPSFPPGMDRLTKDDRIVPWLKVEYDLGEIQNGWRLMVHQSNPFDATTEVILYREDRRAGKSIYLWDLHSPRTSVIISQAKGNVIRTICMGIRLHEDGMRRSDTFKVFRNFSRERSWGTMRVSVDDHDYNVVMPSSLFSYGHGVAEPHHKARIQVSP